MSHLLNLFVLMFLFIFNDVVFSVLKEILRLEFLNSFVIKLVSFLMYVNFAHFLLICSSCILVLFYILFDDFIQNDGILLVITYNLL